MVTPADAAEQRAASTAKLEHFYDPERIQPAIDTSMGIVLTDTVSTRLHDFVVRATSKLLAITGPRRMHTMTPSKMTQVAASILASAISAGLPTISYFCEIDRDVQLEEGDTRESLALLALMYALLKQLTDMLPPDDNDKPDFGVLDGTLETWPQAIVLLDDLLSRAPPLLYCIIDGLQYLDDDSTERELDELFALLQNHSTHNDRSGEVCKVLLTTAGRSRCLYKNWSNADMITVEEGGPNPRGVRGGHRQALGRSFGD